MEPVSETKPVHEAAHYHFGFHAFASDAAHVLAATLWRQPIHLKWPTVLAGNVLFRLGHRFERDKISDG